MVFIVPLTEGDSLGAKRQAGGRVGLDVSSRAPAGCNMARARPLRELRSRCPPPREGDNTLWSLLRRTRGAPIRKFNTQPLAFLNSFNPSNQSIRIRFLIADGLREIVFRIFKHDGRLFDVLRHEHSGQLT